MKKGILSIGLVIIFSTAGFSQDRPKLVVGIVVDQMRQEYLYRFQSKFGEGGFKRLMNDGFMLTNAHYNYVPTYTGPGHASVFTGTTPAYHGIIANDWWDKTLKKKVNCVGDDTQRPIGNAEGHGSVSPARLLATTVTDELKLFSQKKSKVIGISLKDRGAVLPSGHMANAAYWYDSKTGKFISSTYYLQALPAWVDNFNTQKLSDELLNKEWKTLLPIEQYTESSNDDSPYEWVMKGKEKPTFPYDVKKLRQENGNFNFIFNTPMGNDLLEAFAEAAVKGEELGKNTYPDFLTVSFSATDYIAHAMGPNSVEVEDTYLRLDRNIADLLKKLDSEVGNGNYLLFLTADHAVVEVPQLLKDNRMPSGYFVDDNAIKNELNNLLNTHFPGKTLVESVSNDQVFFNTTLFSSDTRTSGIDYMIATELIVNYLQAKDGVAQVFSKNTIKLGDYAEAGIKGAIIRGYNFKRSGDVTFVLEPGWISSDKKYGTTHGSPYSYDTHIPVLFFGKGIRHGSSAQYHPIVDIAPTVSVLLSIKFPSACAGQPILEIVGGK
ncbi:MAG: alkaline phosphatase [Cytophagales bacterium]|jgi:predicted AlkP superfamily pyrophosphatase or phosphodiesterase|nr:alkaline phosphatase family protein [Bacteroidota bacterium]MBS1982475.1 alkaline phosphatase family protein [Bacteroidota bacterium]WHZ06258.1 MAG: alkaline phosphatase [Cytophagales bacterium]